MGCLHNVKDLWENRERGQSIISFSSVTCLLAYVSAVISRETNRKSAFDCIATQIFRKFSKTGKGKKKEEVATVVREGTN